MSAPDVKRIKLTPETRAWVRKVFEDRDKLAELRKQEKVFSVSNERGA